MPRHLLNQKSLNHRYPNHPKPRTIVVSTDSCDARRANAVATEENVRAESRLE